MKRYVMLFQSELYKLLHSSLAYVHIFVPILGITVFLAYYTISPWNEPEKVSAYLQILAMIFPVLIAVITTITSEMEAQAGFFQGLLSIPCEKRVIHIVKLDVLLMFGLISTFVTVAGFGMLFRWMGNIGFSSSFYSKAAILLFSGNIPSYILHYMISFALPKGVGLGLGIMGSLLSALLLTGLGDMIWYYLPWSISVRMCSIFVENEVKNRIFMEGIGVKNGLSFMIIASFFLFLSLIFWGMKWEASKHVQE